MVMSSRSALFLRRGRLSKSAPASVIMSIRRGFNPCVCVCVCVFIKLHITAQSGPVILVVLCHSHWSSQGGINDTCYENL